MKKIICSLLLGTIISFSGLGLAGPPDDCDLCKLAHGGSVFGVPGACAGLC